MRAIGRKGRKGLALLALLVTGCAGPPGGPGSPVADLGASGARVRLDAVRRIRTDPGDLRAPLTRLARGPARSPARAWAVWLLAGRGEAGPGVLGELAADHDPEVRFRALEGIGRLGGDPGSAAAALGDPHPVVRVAAAYALARTGDPRGVEALLAALSRHARAAVSREAAGFLVALHGPRVRYDPHGGWRHRDLARRRWEDTLAAEGLLPAGGRPDDPAPRERAVLRSALTAAGRDPPRGRAGLLALWSLAVSAGGRHPEVAEARAELLTFVVGHLRAEGLLHRDLALALFHAGRGADALRHFSIADRLLPSEPGLLQDWGSALAAAGRTGEALRCFRSATLLDPASEESWLAVGRTRLLRGEPEGAADALLRAEELNPGRWFDHRLLLGRLPGP